MKHRLPKLRLPGNPLNTLFGRMVILMVIMLIADHSVWWITFDRGQMSQQHSSRMERNTLLAVSAIRQLDRLEHSDHPDPAQLQMLRTALADVRQVDVDAPEAPKVRTTASTESGAAPASGMGPNTIPGSLPDASINAASVAGPVAGSFGPPPGAPGSWSGQPGPAGNPPATFNPAPPPGGPGGPSFTADMFLHGGPLFVPRMQGGATPDIAQSLQRDLPAGTQIWFNPPPKMETWILLPDSRTWYVLSSDGGPPPGGTPYKAVFIELSLAIVFAIAAAWQLQKPLAELARAAINFRPNRPPFKVRERGPREVKRVIHHFNETVKELYENEQDREVMLAGVAHDLRSPITRVRARAEVIADERLANGFIRDADSLSQIVDRFLDFSKLSVDESPPISVEAFCSAQWGSPESHLERPAEILLQFKAGDAFKLPVTDIERIVSNLIENAIAYGAGPIEIRTGRALDDRPQRLDGPQPCWELTVRDHGRGIPAAKLEQATRPFVRLDASRGGDAHCGLGLAIVNKLVQRHDGTLKLSNAPTGGLQVVMRFPAEPTAN